MRRGEARAIPTYAPRPPADACLLHRSRVVPHDELRLDLWSVSIATPTMISSDVPPEEDADAHTSVMEPGERGNRAARR